MQVGRRLSETGTAALAWGDLWDWCRYAPLTSQLAVALHGDAVTWNTTDHLLAAAVDALNAANWQRGGGKGSRPRPVPRPGKDSTTKLGREAIPIKDFDSWWDGE